MKDFTIHDSGYRYRWSRPYITIFISLICLLRGLRYTGSLPDSAYQQRSSPLSCNIRRIQQPVLPIIINCPKPVQSSNLVYVQHMFWTIVQPPARRQGNLTVSICRILLRLPCNLLSVVEGSNIPDIKCLPRDWTSPSQRSSALTFNTFLQHQQSLLQHLLQQRSSKWKQSLPSRCLII